MFFLGGGGGGERDTTLGLWSSTRSAHSMPFHWGWGADKTNNHTDME